MASTSASTDSTTRTSTATSSTSGATTSTTSQTTTSSVPTSSGTTSAATAGIAIASGSTASSAATAGIGATVGITASGAATAGSGAAIVSLSRPSISLTTSADTTTVSPEPTTTTPYVPARAFPPVMENRYRINYWATCNHYWQFTTDMKFTDQGSASTFVRDQVAQRRSYFRTACIDSMTMTTTRSPPDATCCVVCQDEDLLINVPGFNETDNITKPLNGDLVYPITLELGLDSTDSQAVRFVGTSDTCVTLGLIANDAPYSRTCLQRPEKCDYGLSASVWVNFTADGYQKEILLSTISGANQGFQFFTESGQLRVLVVGAKGRWYAFIDNFDKKVGKWRLLGFTWERSTGIIQIYIDSVVQVFYYQQTYTAPNTQGDPAAQINLGCEVGTGGASRNFLKGILIHPALWLWPIHQENLILLTGALVYKLIKYQAPVTTAVPTTAPKPTFAFSSVLKEAKFDFTDANPYYSLADFYFRGYDLQNNVSQAVNNISVTDIQSRNSAGLAHFRFVGTPALFSFEGLTGSCVANPDLCPDGISVSFWIGAFQSLDTAPMEFLRFNIFSFVVYNSSGVVMLQVQARARNINLRLNPRQWYNVGFIYNQRGTSPVLTAYLNGLLKDSATVDSGSAITSTNLGKVTIGSSTGAAPVGLLFNDFAAWYRSFEEFEVHKFLGYTRDQLRFIRDATHYWTTDQFVLADGLALSGSERYNLKSQYRSNSIGIIGSSIKFDTDRFNKSNAITLFNNGNPITAFAGQIFLGNEFSPVPSEKSIMWYGNCLTDPFQRSCQINGLSMHMWINIKSVNKTRKQFFFNSGDLGDARSSTLDSRGISLFTTGNLLGASLSTDRNDWAIVIDSNRYGLNEWFNLGFTWREQEGMRLFLNGTDYGIKNLHPDISYKAYDKHTRAVIGRFDDDQNITWQSNKEWVLGNFSYSDVVFYERWMSPEDFSQAIGSVNNRYYATSDFLTFGEAIIDTEFNLMKQAWMYGVSIGPKGVVSSEQSPVKSARISTRGEVGVKAYMPDECPRKLAACQNQVLFSTWVQILSKDNGTSFTVLSLGEHNDSSEGFGLHISSDSTLMAWVKRSSLSYKMISKSNTKVRFNRWLNLALHLSKTNFYPTIYLNGSNVSVSLELRTEGVTYQANTAAATLKLGRRSSDASFNGSFLVHVVSAWYNTLLPANQMYTMLGMQSSQYDLMSFSDEYWTVSGFWNKLQPRPMDGVNVQLSPDKYDVENGAMCTLGTGGSYVRLGDLLDSCLLNTAPCKAFILTLNMKPKLPATLGKAYILSTGGQNPGHLGTAISITSDGLLYATVRSSNKTCETIVPFNYTDWIQLQLRWYSEAVIAIKVDEETISRRIGTNSSCWQEVNDNATYTVGQLGKVNSNMTNASIACYSDVMFVYQLLGSSGSIDIDVTPTNCYEQQTTYNPLIGGLANYAGKPNRSRQFRTAENLDIGTEVCFFSPAGCSKGIVMSMWLKIDSLTSDIAEVFNSGFPSNQGLRIRVKKTGASTYIVLVNSSFSLKSRFVEGNPDTDKLGFGSWVNLGVSVLADSIELYQNGIRTQAATKFTVDTLASPTPAPGTSLTVRLGDPSLSMTASDLVFWNEPPLNCLNPNKNKKLLTGDCATSTETMASTCLPNSASSCMTTIQNNMCLDPDFDNVVAIDKANQLFTSKTDASTACKIIASTASDKGYRDDFVQASINILNRISDNLVINVAIDNDTLNATVGDFSRAFSSVMDPKFSSNFKAALSAGTISPSTVFTSNEGMALRLASKIASDCSPVMMTEGRMHWSAQKIGPSCSASPVSPLKYTDVTRDSWSAPKDAMFLPSSLFSGRTDVRVACVVYDKIDNLIPSVSTNDTSFSNSTNKTIDLTVNSRVVSVKTNLPAAVIAKLDDPVNITLELKQPNQKKKKESVLRYETRCAYWDTDQKKWSTQGCAKDSEDEFTVNCKCTHMTSFAVLMQPVPVAEDNIHERILSMLTYVLIGISLLCLLIFALVIASTKKLRGERYVLHLNLAGALFIAQLAFVFTDMARNNDGFCKAIAIIMHLFFVATFTLLFVEGIWVFYAVTKGIIRGRLKWWLPVAWLIPIIIVAAVCGINSSAYGNSRCWISGIYIWAFLGPLVGFGCLTLLVCLIVICNLNEPAIKRKDILNDLRNHTHQCAFLIPLMILAWLFGVLLVQWYSIPIEYFFVIFNAPQGFWVFLCFGLLNPDFKEVLCLRRNRASVGSSAVSITGVQDIHSSKTSIETTGSQAAIIPSSTSTKQNTSSKQQKQQPKQPQQPPQPQQPQKQPSAPVYYTGKEKSKKPQRENSDEYEETTSSQARLQTSARSVRSAASSRGQLRGQDSDADRPGTPRNEKFTPPGAVE